MRLKFKENPREWQKFTAITALAWSIMSLLLWRRKIIAVQVFIAVVAVLGAAVLTCLLRPSWFRVYYRGGMRVGFTIGQTIERVILFLFFLCVLTPFALIARLMGKDLLKLKKDPHATTYWQPAKMDNQFDREF